MQLNGSTKKASHPKSTVYGFRMVSNITLIGCYNSLLYVCSVYDVQASANTPKQPIKSLDLVDKPSGFKYNNM